MAEYITTSPQQTMALGEALARTLSGGEVVAFTGGMGAGKTTFCRGMALGLGSIDPVASPTFTVANLYRGRVPFAHFDATRLESAAELEGTGFYEYMEEGAVVAVEWSERVAEALAGPLIRVDIAVTGEETRRITIDGMAEEEAL